MIGTCILISTLNSNFYLIIKLDLIFQQLQLFLPLEDLKLWHEVRHTNELAPLVGEALESTRNGEQKSIQRTPFGSLMISFHRFLTGIS